MFKGSLGIVISIVLLVPITMGAALPGPEVAGHGVQGVGSRGETVVLPHEALRVKVDLKTHEMTLDTIPKQQIALFADQEEPTPNCLSSARLSWVQLDAQVNINGPDPFGQLAVPDALGSCRWGAGILQPPQELTFIMADMEKGNVDGQNHDDSFIYLECDFIGGGIGSVTDVYGPTHTATCVYRQGGADPLEWTYWDSLMRLRGHPPAGEAAGFGYASFQ